MLNSFLRKIAYFFRRKIEVIFPPKSFLPAALNLKHDIGLSRSLNEVAICCAFLNTEMSQCSELHCIDVGFHRGSSSAEMLKVFGGVLAFEPSPRILDLADQSVLKDPRLDLRRCAISTHASDGWLYLSEVSDGVSSLIQTPSLHNERIRIQSTTLDSALTTYETKDVSGFALIKIDVEGLELEVLRQIGDCAALRPEIIISEFQDTKSSFGDLERQMSLLHQMGYHCVLSVWKPVLRYGVSHEWERFIPVDPVDSAHTAKLMFSSNGNIIAVKPNRYNRFMQSLADLEISGKGF
jgi:FkbM family methyltransferase